MHIDEMSKIITKNYEEGGVVHAVLVIFSDGYMIQTTPGAKTVLVEQEVKFLPGRRDAFGIPPHDHGDSKLSELDEGELLDLIPKISKWHGPPIFMGSALVRKVGRFQASLFALPPAAYSGEGAYVVSALGPSDLNQKMLSAEEVAALLKSGEKVPTPEHDHWFLSDKPVSLSAALWVFRSLTEENITATNCNCAPPSQRPRMHGLSTFSTPFGEGEDEPDETFVGEDDEG